MDLDRHAIERRDFPLTRRGYDPAAVDAHLRALADEVERLRREAGAGGVVSLATNAGVQVQGIIQAAEQAAAVMERQAAEAAQTTRATAEADAARTREAAVDQVREQVGAVSRAAEALLTSVDTMDGEIGALLGQLRGGAQRISAQLERATGSVGELHGSLIAAAPAAALPAPAPPQIAPAIPAAAAPAIAPAAQPAPAPAEPRPPEAPVAAEPAASEPAPSEAASVGASGGADIDKARLVAVNMALGGASPEETARHLADVYGVGDADGLVADVYAAIDG
ncbi:MAG TPA: DivIVA domain-containing protein [Solirubrobacteraceae bacterium]|nr:DivIVA domain-containing protein [Solirubrobacteraceae bacterium]